VEMIKKLLKNRLFIMGILIPLIFQVVYLCIVIPALKDGNSGVQNLKIAIVNEDQVLGKNISTTLSQVLPVKTELSSDLSGTMDTMNDGDLNMVIHIPASFTAGLQQGAGQISYYINQSAPSMTKQLMERIALNINETLNENTFNNIKETLKKNSAVALSQTGLPENSAAAISANIDQAFDSLKYASIKADIQKVNNAEGFIQTVFPFFIFLTYFVGCIILIAAHSFAFKSLRKEYSKGKIWLTKLGADIIAALVFPCVVIGLAACFNIPFALGIGTTWLVLSLGFLSMTTLLQMFIDWFGYVGMGLAALILFPIQLITSGLIYSREILPSFYTVISAYLPVTYFGDGILKIFYGGASVSRDAWLLLSMAVIFIVVSALSLLKKERPLI